MDTLPTDTFKRHRFPPDIIRHAVCLYYRFNLCHRDIEDLLAERGVFVSYESIRLWRSKFGPEFAGTLQRKLQGYGVTFCFWRQGTRLCVAQRCCRCARGVIFLNVSVAFADQRADPRFGEVVKRVGLPTDDT